MRPPTCAYCCSRPAGRRGASRRYNLTHHGRPCCQPCLDDFESGRRPPPPLPADRRPGRPRAAADPDAAAAWDDLIRASEEDR